MSQESKNPNPLGLLVGVTYLVRHTPSNPDGAFEEVTITRMTEHGHPWGEWTNRQHNGILTDCYEVKLEVEHLAARMFQALSHLLYLKVHAETMGKDEFYHITKAGAWQGAADAANAYMRRYLKK
jgi:hypothetical protein